MIRPIDTQILYPNSPQLSNRQQVDNQKPNLQQEQFANLMQKECLEKKERVVHTEEGQKIRNATDQNKQHQGKQGKREKKAAPHKKQADSQRAYSESQFDIRI